jgi:hypothetical protein
VSKLFLPMMTTSVCQEHGCEGKYLQFNAAAVRERRPQSLIILVILTVLSWKAKGNHHDVPIHLEIR